MRKILICGVALFLGGCNFSFLSGLNSSSPSAQPTPTPADAAIKAKEAEVVCRWAKAAGVPTLSLSVSDTSATQRGVVTVVASWRTTCPADAAAAKK